MSNPDVPKRVEALTILPFRNVVYPKTVALQELTTRTYTVLRTNVQTDMSSLPKNSSPGRMLIDRYRAIARDPGTFFSPGGLSIKSDSLDKFYSLPPQHTFQDVAAVGFADTIDQYMNPGQIGSRKP